MDRAVYIAHGAKSSFPDSPAARDGPVTEVWPIRGELRVTGQVISFPLHNNFLLASFVTLLLGVVHDTSTHSSHLRCECHTPRLAHQEAGDGARTLKTS